MRQLLFVGATLIVVGLVGVGFGFLFDWEPVATLAGTAAIMMFLSFALHYIAGGRRD